MNRKATKWTVLSLALLVLLAQDGTAGQKKQVAKKPYVTETSKPTPKDEAVDQQLVKELVEIISSTESPTTFVLTVMALEEIGPKARSTVPAIIRNAERLKIFTTTSTMVSPNGIPSKKQQMATAVAQAIAHLLSGNRNASPPPPPACQPVPTTARFPFFAPPPPPPSYSGY